MTRPDAGQASFDLDRLTHLEELESEAEPSGAPLTFTIDYWAPAGLDRVFEQWQRLRCSFASIPTSHLWHRSLGVEAAVRRGEHVAVRFSAGLRCQPDQHPDTVCARVRR